MDRSSAEGALVEALKVPRGMGCGGGCVPLPTGEGSGEAARPLPRIFFII